MGNNAQSLYEKALKIATDAHKGQKDKAGVDYITHPVAVAAMVNGEKEKAVALLHDVIEDTPITAEDLMNDFDMEIVYAVLLLTKTEGIDMGEYLSKIYSNPIARAVKIADLTHNSDLSRFTAMGLTPSKRDIDRRDRYIQYKKYLTGEI